MKLRRLARNGPHDDPLPWHADHTERCHALAGWRLLLREPFQELDRFDAKYPETRSPKSDRIRAELCAMIEEWEAHLKAKG